MDENELYDETMRKGTDLNPEQENPIDTSIAGGKDAYIERGELDENLEIENAKVAYGSLGKTFVQAENEFFDRAKSHSTQQKKSDTDLGDSTSHGDKIPDSPDKKEKKSKPNHARTAVFFAVVSLIFFAFGIVNMVSANNYKTLAHVSAHKNISELCESLNAISVNLQKSLYSNNAQMLTSLSSELYKESSLAKTALSSMTSEEFESSEIYKFLSQVGDFVFSLTQSESLNLTQKQKQDLLALYEYSTSLTQSFLSARNGIFDGEISLDETVSTLMKKGETLPKSFLSSMQDTTQALTDYPTLIYDGPFADTVLEKEALMLKNSKEISKEDAKSIAGEVLNVEPGSLRECEDVSSTIEMYCFSRGEHSVGIAKKGGYLVYLMSGEFADEVKIDEDKAIKIAQTFLKNVGYSDMISTYYYDYDGICTINFAYKKGDITYYSDLIKVSVRLDNGEVCALDAHGYLMNHSVRELPKTTLTEAEILTKVSKDLSVIDVKKAVIPKESGKEVLCYQVHCKDQNEQEILLYLNAVTAEEEDILIMLYSDDGILVR